MQYLLDTDTCVDLLRGVGSVVARLKKLTPDDCGISAISSFELFTGAAKVRDPRRETAKIDALLEVVEELPFAGTEARRAGSLRALLEKAGTPIGAYDLLIAAHALTTELILVTANTAEFSQVRGLALENWR
jgi:tRNA(fMet)-specific endonuclease VapC